MITLVSVMMRIEDDAVDVDDYMNIDGVGVDDD